MPTFKIRPEGIKEIRKQMLVRIIPVMIVAVTIGIIISTVNTADKESSVNVLPFIIPLVAVATAYGLYGGIKRQTALLESFILTITDNMVTREQLNTPTISIYHNDIREISKNKDGSFIIKGKNATDKIIIPAQIENYADLEANLNSIKPLAADVDKPFLERYGILTTLGTFGLMLCVFLVTNKIIVTVAGIIFIALTSWSFYEIRRNKSIDARTKRSMWWVLVVMAGVIGVVTMKLLS